MSHAVVCPNCGARVQDRNNRSYATCEYCGSKVMITEGSGKQTSLSKSDELVDRAMVYLQLKYYYSAKESIDKALKLRPDNCRAYLADLMRICNCCVEEDLKEHTVKPLHEYASFSLAYEFGDDDLRQRLLEYDRIVTKRVTDTTSQQMLKKIKAKTDELNKISNLHSECMDKKEKFKRVGVVGNTGIVLAVIAAFVILIATEAGIIFLPAPIVLLVWSIIVGHPYNSAVNKDPGEDAVNSLREEVDELNAKYQKHCERLKEYS